MIAKTIYRFKLQCGAENFMTLTLQDYLSKQKVTFGDSITRCRIKHDNTM